VRLGDNKIFQQQAMIKFISLGSQIYPNDPAVHSFAFYDTLTDRFLTYGGVQAWDSWEDFVDDFEEQAGVALEELTRITPPAIRLDA
jgi:hypothetical protein